MKCLETGDANTTANVKIPTFKKCLLMIIISLIKNAIFNKTSLNACFLNSMKVMIILISNFMITIVAKSMESLKVTNNYLIKI